MPNQISYVAVWSKDLEANRHVFATLLGIPIAYEDDNVIVFQTEGTQLVLQRAVGADSGLAGTVGVGFDVDNVEELSNQLRADGQILDVDLERFDNQQRVTALRLASGQLVEFVGD
jgi:catechol 2,3-dioxygenase-like lactoylglutathione lyase family enzyme